MPGSLAPARRLAIALGLLILRAGRRQRISWPAAQHARGAGKALGDRHVKVLHERRLACPGPRQHERLQALLLHGLSDREGAVARTHLAVERQLTEQRMARQALWRELVGGGQHRAGEREIEAGADLGDVAGGEVGGDPPVGELIPGVEDRRAHAIARLAHRGVGETDDRERRQPGADVDLHGHRARLQPLDRKSERSRQHVASLARTCRGRLIRRLSAS